MIGIEACEFASCGRKTSVQEILLSLVVSGSNCTLSGVDGCLKDLLRVGASIEIHCCMTLTHDVVKVNIVAVEVVHRSVMLSQTVDSCTSQVLHVSWL